MLPVEIQSLQPYHNSLTNKTPEWTLSERPDCVHGAVRRFSAFRPFDSSAKCVPKRSMNYFLKIRFTWSFSAMIMPMEKHVKTENCAGQTMSCGDEGGFPLFRNDYSRLRRYFSDAWRAHFWYVCIDFVDYYHQCRSITVVTLWIRPVFRWVNRVRVRVILYGCPVYSEYEWPTVRIVKPEAVAVRVVDVRRGRTGIHIHEPRTPVAEQEAWRWNGGKGFRILYPSKNISVPYWVSTLVSPTHSWHDCKPNLKWTLKLFVANADQPRCLSARTHAATSTCWRIPVDDSSRARSEWSNTWSKSSMRIRSRQRRSV